MTVYFPTIEQLNKQLTDFDDIEKKDADYCEDTYSHFETNPLDVVDELIKLSNSSRISKRSKILLEYVAHHFQSNIYKGY